MAKRDFLIGESALRTDGKGGVCLGAGQRSGPCRGCATNRQATVGFSMRNACQALGSAISISRFRPHCLDASMTPRRSRSKTFSTGWATPRSVSSGTSLRDAQLDHLLDEPLLPITLRQRHTQGHRDPRLAVNFLAAGNCQFDFAATGPLDDRIELPARAIKERDAGAGLGPHHVQQMMGLGAGRRARPDTTGDSTK